MDDTTEGYKKLLQEANDKLAYAGRDVFQARVDLINQRESQSVSLIAMGQEIGVLKTFIESAEFKSRPVMLQEAISRGDGYFEDLCEARQEIASLRRKLGGDDYKPKPVRDDVLEEYEEMARSDHDAES